ncbi:MAG: hypothetical protein AOA65_1844 [Candidatus Bathyarchaeota archaeon BA1]|nr:MAG: hypothetical protein AOA65_1844 [Candidatus Bathyarchaeota archaeon BA1]
MKREKREITCIICPIGCRARVTMENGEITEIDNIECQRGEEHTRKEIEAPMRDFFTTVRVRGAGIPVLPARATQPIPKGRLMECALELAKIVLDTPIKAGDAIIKNILDLGVDIIATRSLDHIGGELKANNQK